MQQVKLFVRRRIALLLALVMVLSMMPIGSVATETLQEENVVSAAKVDPVKPMSDTYSEGGLVYTLYADHAEVAEYTGSATEVIIPAEIEGLPVTGIGAYVFSWCSWLESVDLPEGLTIIGEGAFARCEVLASIDLPESLTAIGDSAFEGCWALLSIDIPAAVTNIGYNAFDACSGLCTITVSPQNTVYSSINGILYGDAGTRLIRCPGAYSGAVKIPAGVVAIESNAFSGCDGLTSVTIPEGVTSIGSSAFANCDGLTSVTIPYGVTTIEAGVFSYCTNLTSVEMPDSVTAIEEEAFYCCTSLKSVMIPEGVTYIGEDAFDNCTSLVSVTIPESVTSIGSYAFSLCESLTSITIPDGVTKIENGVFGYCTNLTSVEIPEKVTYIGRDAFSYCINLKSVKIPDSVTFIGINAFRNCDSLTSVVIPDSVTGVGQTAFLDCDALESVEWTDSVQSISWRTLANCDNLKTLMLPGSVTTIAYEATWNCNNLSDVYYDGTASEWSLVSIGVRNTGIENATIHFNDGTTSILVIDKEDENAKFSYYSTVTEETAEYNFSYDESWFFEDSLSYNHELAQMSIRMAMAAARKSSVSIEELFTTLGITEENRTISYPTPLRDTIGYAIGSKEVVNEAGETITLIAVAIRGGGYGMEWASNVMVGNHPEHHGFDESSVAVTDAIEAHIQKVGAEKNIKIWITGFSRAAAVSNLVAERLNTWVDAGLIPGLEKDGIYAYCFATPQSVTSESDYYGENSKNVFNIVNPCDLVPMVAPSEWDFNRCGTTYYLPSRQLNNSGYNKSYAAMEGNYINILMNAGVELPNVSLFTSTIPFQRTTFSSFVDTVAHVMGGQSEFYNDYQELFVDIMAATNESYLDAGVLIDAVEAIDILEQNPSLIPWLGVILLAKDNLAHAHYPELYLAWMDAVDGDFPSDENRVRYLKVNCPVNITVYDADGAVVAQIIDDVVQTIEGSTIEANVDVNGQKVIALPADMQFHIDVTATDDGTLSYQIEEYDLDLGGTVRIVNYYNVEIVKNDVLEGTVGIWDGSNPAEYSLEYADGTELSVSNELTGEDIADWSVYVASEGEGTVTGGGYFREGEYAKVTADAAENTEFVGWYVNDLLVSTELEYRFRVESDLNIIGKFTAKHEHNWDDGTITKEATCTESGEITYTCTGCDETRVETIESNGHAYETVVTAPTCTEQGYSTHICFNCGDSYVDTYVDATGHSFGEWTETKAATCTEKGEETRSCACGETETREVDALNHNYESVVTAPTCTEQGYTTHTCARCGDSYMDSSTEALGHDYVSVVTEPTETEQGYTTHTCTRCDDSYVDSYTDPLGHEHTWDEGVVTKEATCTEPGEKTYTCGICGDTMAEEIPVTDHNYEDGICTSCGAEDPDHQPSVEDPTEEPTEEPSEDSTEAPTEKPTKVPSEDADDDAPDTGDAMHAILWMSMLFVSLMGVTVLILNREKWHNI